MIMPGEANAHRVNIFTWQEGDHVTAQVYWANGKPVSNATLTVTAPDGAVAFRGKTRKDGLCSFNLPKPGKYKVAVKAAMGHAAGANIDFMANPALPTRSGNTDKGNLEHAPDIVTQGPAGTVSADLMPGSAQEQEEKSGCECITAQEFKTVLDSRLKPVIREIALIREENMKISPKDVIAGLGYIAGLAGIALWATNRKQNGK